MEGYYLLAGLIIGFVIGILVGRKHKNAVEKVVTDVEKKIK